MTFPTLLMLSAGHWAGRGGGGGWWFWPLIPLLWLTLVGVTVWLITRRRRSPEPTGMQHARAVLAERYAQGELSTQEYRERLSNLGDGR